MTTAARPHSLAATTRDLDAPGRGLVIMAAGFMIMSTTDGVAKFLAAEIAPAEIAWARFFFQCFLTIPLVVAATGWRSLLPRHVFGNTMRGVLLSSGTVMFFVGLKKIPLADSAAIFFINPFILTILSAVFEGEKVGWRRWTAIVVGFGGALLVIQPSFAAFGPYALLPAGSALCLAVYMLLNRRLRDSGSAMALQTFAGLAGMVTITLFLAIGSFIGVEDFTVVAPSALQWGMLLLIGGFAALGHYCMIVAFRYATPAVLAPMAYTQIVSSTALGYFVFGDFPDLGKWIGITIIIACGVFIFWRETRVKAQAA